MTEYEGEKREAMTLGFEEGTYEAIKSVVPEPLVRVRIEAPADAEAGVAAMTLDVLGATVDEEKSEEVVEAVREKVGDSGVQALVTGIDPMDFTRLMRLGFEEAQAKYGGKALVVFFLGSEPWPLLWARQTNGANYDIDTQQIVDRLKAWGKMCQMELTGAGFDWVAMRFHTLPDELLGFAEEVYAFCPDVLDQGVVKETPAAMEEMSDEELMEFMEGAIEEQGTEDLAAFLEREQRLFLWWD